MSTFDFTRAYKDAAQLVALENAATRFLELPTSTAASSDLQRLLTEAGPAIERIRAQAAHDANAAYAAICKEEERDCGCGNHPGDVQ